MAQFLFLSAFQGEKKTYEILSYLDNETLTMK